jgi:hypothetical protein
MEKRVLIFHGISRKNELASFEINAELVKILSKVPTTRKQMQKQTNKQTKTLNSTSI